MSSSGVTEVSSNKMFGGFQKIYSHESKELGCKMNFAVFLPEQIENKKLPVIYWLSGLTCNESNFVQKAGAQKYAAQHGIVVVCPDTSPRGVTIPGDSDNWDFGVGAGFYVDATQKPWSQNYRMYSYVTNELINIVNSNFNVLEGIASIMGHSMGGHGALICALKNPGLYKSVSAFSPICNPINCPWGTKAFSGYLGDKESSDWTAWDATELVKKYSGPPLELFIDQGSEDNFYKQKQLLPENLMKAAISSKMPIVMNMRDGYDHSYFYIATFIEEHMEYHAKRLL